MIWNGLICITFLKLLIVTIQELTLYKCMNLLYNLKSV